MTDAKMGKESTVVEMKENFPFGELKEATND